MQKHGFFVGFVVLVLCLKNCELVPSKIDLGEINYTEDDLPKLYWMENYNKCVKSGGSFCIVDFLIQPEDSQSKLSQEIKKSKQNIFRFDRSKLYRMMCVNESSSDMRTVMKNSADSELSNFSLATEITGVRCRPNQELSLNSLDLVYAILLVAYVVLVLKSTKYDLFERRRDKFVKSKYENIYNIFSIRKNWEKILKDNPNQNFQRLKFLQGIRFYLMVLVVACHTKISFGSLFLENPIAIEKMLRSIFYSLQFDLFIIQTFFMISCFLLTNQIFELYKSNGKFALYDCWLLYVNRVMRLFPTVLILILLAQVLTKIIPIGPQVWDLFFMVFKECQTKWWMTLLQVNFVQAFGQMCMPGTWYLGVDTLFYFTTIFLLYVTFKFKLDLKKVLAVSIVAMSLKFAHVIYTNDSDVMFITTADTFRDLYHSHEFDNLYISPWSSYSTCCVGIAMGAIYFHIKDMDMKFNIVHNIIWYVTFFGGPIVLVYIATRQYESILVRMLLGSLLKPAYALVMGIGVLGLTTKLGGAVRKILELDLAVKMSNFTYCVYLYHFLMVFSKGVFSHNLIYFKPVHMVVYLFIDVVGSFLIGCLCTITIELPWSEIQKLYFPQVKKAKMVVKGNKEEENNMSLVGQQKIKNS